MNKITTTTVLVLGICLSACAPQSRTKSPSPQGGQTGNGGFLYSKTSIPILDKAQKALLTALGKADAAIISASVNSQYPVDKSELVKIISNMKKDKYSGSNDSDVNLLGKREEKYFSVNARQVVAQPLYFQSYAARTIEPLVIYDVMTAILHESLHIFGYDERGSLKYSKAILEEIGLTKQCFANSIYKHGLECLSGGSNLQGQRRQDIEGVINGKVSYIDVFESGNRDEEIQAYGLAKPKLRLTQGSEAGTLSGKINTDEVTGRFDNLKCESTETEIKCKSDGRTFGLTNSNGMAKVSELVITESGVTITMAGNETAIMLFPLVLSNNYNIWMKREITPATANDEATAEAPESDDLGLIYKSSLDSEGLM